MTEKMFTGIVQATGRLTAREEAREATAPQAAFRIQTPFADLALGESVAVDGVCLTVVERDATGAALFHLSPETLSRTAFGRAEIGAEFNLERALRAADRLSGHIVQGHVDGLATLTACQAEADFWRLRCTLPPALIRYCVEKGSIALNGVSLTINDLIGDEVGIQLIPYTYAHTSFRVRRVGDRLHCEVDVLAKYVERLLIPLAPSATARRLHGDHQAPRGEGVSP